MSSHSVTDRNRPPAGNQTFASDNTAGLCPEAWAALAEANQGRLPSYGNDSWTITACNRLRELFETDCEVFFVFNGTSANSLSLASLCQSYHSVICHDYAHVETDECGAPEFFSNGTKILVASGPNGKLDPAQVERVILKRTDIHYPKPRVLSVTQSTEWGTVYTVDELKALTGLAKKHGLAVHMDGSRFSNAVASANLRGKVSPADLSWRAGVDVLCFGGTKNGMALTEAVVFFNKAMAHEFDYRCKQAGQLASKMRFLSAQWVGMLKDGAWLKHAAHANLMTAKLADGVRKIPGVDIAVEPEVNALFVNLKPQVAHAMEARGWHFYSFIGAHGYRLMCSWDTRQEDVDAFVADLAAVSKA